MSGAAIGIICKAPLPGRSKTRLASAIGADAASQLSACFLRDVATAIDGVPEGLGRRGYGVYAQRYNSAGVPQGSEFQVNTTTAGACERR